MTQEARVQKFIAQSGYCSRRKAEILIEKGLVKVNGKTVSLGDHCLESDVVEVEGKQIETSLEKIYIILNKASGYVTTRSDEFGRKTVYDLLKKEDMKMGLFTIGRLDKDTTGLLIITNDGEFSQKVIHPSSSITKTYSFILDKKLKDDDRRTIEKGLFLDARKLSPCKIRNMKNLYEIEISEGRKRQVRRIFEMRGYEVRELKRVAIGGLRLDDFSLREGEYAKVRKEELEKIFH